MKILVNIEKFKGWFPAFEEVTEVQLNAAYSSAESIISANIGEIVLPENLQERGVYLATAHSLYLQLNPNLIAQGVVASATEGSVSASFSRPAYKNWFEYWLSLSPYGLELLALLGQVQPPMPKRPLFSPYYRGGRF